jgi:hypothetical protein
MSLHSHTVQHFRTAVWHGAWACASWRWLVPVSIWSGNCTWADIRRPWRANSWIRYSFLIANIASRTSSWQSRVGSSMQRRAFNKMRVVEIRRHQRLVRCSPMIEKQVVVVGTTTTRPWHHPTDVRDHRAKPNREHRRCDANRNFQTDPTRMDTIIFPQIVAVTSNCLEMTIVEWKQGNILTATSTTTTRSRGRDVTNDSSPVRSDHHQNHPKQRLAHPRNAGSLESLPIESEGRPSLQLACNGVLVHLPYRRSNIVCFFCCVVGHDLRETCHSNKPQIERCKIAETEGSRVWHDNSGFHFRIVCAILIFQFVLILRRLGAAPCHHVGYCFVSQLQQGQESCLGTVVESQIPFDYSNVFPVKTTMYYCRQTLLCLEFQSKCAQSYRYIGIFQIARTFFCSHYQQVES